jgi:hypothetical protein
MMDVVRRIVFVAHGAITLAAAVVLVVAPGLIPSTVGIQLPPGGELLAYLLAGCEFGVAVISLMAATVTDGLAIHVIAAGFAALHLLTGILEVVALVGGAAPFLWGNVVVRVVATVAFAIIAFRPPRPAFSPDVDAETP